MLLLLTFVALILSFALWIYAAAAGLARQRAPEEVQSRSRWVSHGLPAIAFAANMLLLLAVLGDPQDYENGLLNLGGLALAIGALFLLRR